MFHHDSRDYNEAVRQAKEHLEKSIQVRRQSAIELVQKLEQEEPDDYVVPTLLVNVSHNTIETKIKSDRRRGEPISTYSHEYFVDNDKMGKKHVYAPHALTQLCSRLDIPKTFVNNMADKSYGGEVISDTMNKLLKLVPSDRFLMRSVKDDVRGVLSTSYRRLDSRPILDTFMGACANVGAIPCEGIFGDLRFALKAILPNVYVVGGPKSEEVVAVGIQISNSEYGKGTLSLRSFILRVWCTNTATSEEGLRQVHHGSRISDDEIYAQETRDADTRATLLAVRDNIAGTLSKSRVETLMGMLDSAIKDNINPASAYAALKDKMGLSKAEVQGVRDIYNVSNNDIMQLPKGNSRYRMSNAVSFFAQSDTVGKDRRMELERIAGKILMNDLTSSDIA